MSFVLFIQASEPSMSFNILKLVYWLAFCAGSSYCNGYTDREESENEKRRKK